MTDCPLCETTVYNFSNLIRHFKTHTLFIAQQCMSPEEHKKARETQSPLVWKWNDKNTAREICICAVCGKGEHCYRKKKTNYIKKTITDNEGNQKHISISYADRFYEEHQLVCKAKFTSVAYLFDSTIKKPCRTRAKSVASSVAPKVQTVQVSETEKSSESETEKSSESEISKIKDTIATHFDTIFDKYNDENETDEEARQERAKQRSLTVYEMISEVSKHYHSVMKKVRINKESVQSSIASRKKEAILFKSIHILNFELNNDDIDEKIIERIIGQKTCPLKRYVYEVIINEHKKYLVRLMYQTEKGGIILSQTLNRIVNTIPYEYIEIDKKQTMESLLQSKNAIIKGDWSDFNCSPTS